MGTYIRITENGPSATADGHLEDTETVFWSNLECGLCLLAVNLPSLWAIVGKMSTPASQLVASIRSAISLRSLGSGSHRSSRSKTRRPAGDGIIPDGSDRYADDSRVRIHETVKGQNDEWHRLGAIDSRETGTDAPRVSDGVENYVQTARDHDSVV
ncbi:hypothetical protein IMSHALPRED_001943 [Imshaugia aleurites]|uniref:Uncharacterized protein n=1 Tax=Imshaugia aleurites TaxID=172621 RepID=A0A8H3IBF3_9LECA|nr:hypothetical protein IMSHALPRED_001943 [Imshaugia aleurites]